MSKKKIALVGFGHLGRWHAEKIKAFSHLVDFKYIVEPFAKNAELAKIAFPEVSIANNVLEIINDIDAAFVVTPTMYHFELVEVLLKNKKHVFCEKPMTETFEQALKIKEILNENPGLIFQVGHSERFHAAWEKIKSNADFFNELPLYANLKRVAPFKGRATDVDVISDLMIHDLDLLMFLFKEVPVSVESVGFKMRTKYYDYVTSHFKFKRAGFMASITVGRNQTKEVREVEICNEKGTLLIDLMKNEIHSAYGSEPGPDFVKTESYEKRDHLMLEHKYFYDSICFNKVPIIGIDDGLLAIKLISKVRESLESHQLVII